MSVSRWRTKSTSLAPSLLEIRRPHHLLQALRSAAGRLRGTAAQTMVCLTPHLSTLRPIQLGNLLVFVRILLILSQLEPVKGVCQSFSFSSLCSMVRTPSCGDLDVRPILTCMGWSNRCGFEFLRCT
jgi:hypothetical protein